MPIYEYRCKSCGKVTEVLQKMKDKPLKQCPKCAGLLEKLISRSSFQLKGNWYATGYSSNSKASDGESKSADSKTAPASGKASSDSSESSSGSKASSSDAKASSADAKTRKTGSGSQSKD